MKRNLWGTAVVVIYAAFAASTLGFVAFAMTQPVDLVSPDYYQRSLVEDRRIAARDAARGLGDAVSAEVDAAARTVVIRVPSPGAAGTVTLYRPAGSAADRTVPLALRDGRQVLSTAGLASGHWLVQIDWSAGGRPFYYEAAVSLP